MKQVEDQTEKLHQDLYEMSKPLARYADDKDLEKHLRDQEREGDPMLQYIRSKRKESGVKGIFIRSVCIINNYIFKKFYNLHIDNLFILRQKCKICPKIYILFICDNCLKHF